VYINRQFISIFGAKTSIPKTDRIIGSKHNRFLKKCGGKIWIFSKKWRVFTVSLTMEFGEYGNPSNLFWQKRSNKPKKLNRMASWVMIEEL